MKKRLAGIIGMMLVTVCALSGCSGKSEKTEEVSEDFKKIVDEYAVITLRKDGESALIDKAYAAVSEYLDYPGPDQLEVTAQAIEDSYAQLYDQYDQLEDYQMPEDISGLIEDYGIYYEDFMLYATEEKSEIADYIQNLLNLYEYLGYEATDLPMTEEMTFHFNMVDQMQQIQRKYMYTSVNFWFAGRSEAEVAYVQEAVTDKFVSFISDGHEWDNDQKNVEDRLNAYLDEMADMRLEWDIYLGEREAELNSSNQ